MSRGRLRPAEEMVNRLNSWTVANALAVGMLAGVAGATPSGSTAFVHEAVLHGRADAGGLAGDRFGSSLSVSAGILAVGAPGRAGAGGDDIGSVVVYTARAGSWVQQSRLVPVLGNVGSDGFGAAVAAAPDALAVGTRSDSGTTPGVYIYTPSGATWSQSARLFPPDGEMGTTFGSALSMSGN